MIRPTGGAAAGRRRPRGWVWLLVLGFVGLGLWVTWTVVSGLVRLEGVTVAAGRGGGPRLEEVVLEDHGVREKVAVVDLQGIITSELVDPLGFDLVDVIRAQLKRAGQDSRVRAVILRINSPGGEVLASDELYRAVRRFQQEYEKPVVALMENVAASGGYYVAVASRWIVANEMTLTGSIGVILSTWNYRGLMDKVGIRPYTYKSGRFKDMLSGSRDPSEIPPEEREMLQALIDEVFARFKQVVAEGRKAAAEANQSEGRQLVENWEEFADGRVFSGAEAYRLGFVDELGNFETAKERAMALAGVEEANVVRYQRRLTFADLFPFFGGEGRAHTVKVDFGLELPHLRAGHLYFLPPALVP
ncbi:signal peptide peptidase SppA [Limisphaera ngatamarikiensis]|uniref:Signal peptide peptidase SppA n=1 Tax=Limisphaera ngatamarikiensis TaxID=1324935 RepID=A0A6M1RQT9_9BACT|nr:signal peptide peptidase SppA [Limisphaera ngatamarikiensis]